MEKKLNFFERLTGIILKPKRTFAYLADNPDLKVPALLILLFTIWPLIINFTGFLYIIKIPYAHNTFKGWVAFVRLMIVLLMPYFTVWIALSAELYLLGKIVRVRFSVAQSYSIAGYAFIIPFIISFSVPQVIRHLIIHLNSDTITSILDSTYTSGIIHWGYNIFLLTLGVYCITRKTKKTLIIMVIHTLLGMALIYNSGDSTEKHYKNGKLEGVYREYFENRKLKTERTYKNDKLEGITKMYYENRQLKAEETYKDGKLEGPATMYYENGKIKNKATFQNGKKM